MSDPVRRESPLARFAAEASGQPSLEAPGVQLSDRRFRGHVNLRGGPDDAAFLKHSLAFHTDGAPRIDYKDVSITRWPPGERVYGR